MPRALASASESGNSVSTAPWMSSVGALILLSTGAGLDRCSSAVVVTSGVPMVAIFRYAAQTSAANRPQAGFCGGGAGARPAPPPTAPNEDEPLPKKGRAQLFLNTPGAVTPDADCGKKALPRSFQVI